MPARRGGGPLPLAEAQGALGPRRSRALRNLWLTPKADTRGPESAHSDMRKQNVQAAVHDIDCGASGMRAPCLQRALGPHLGALRQGAHMGPAARGNWAHMSAAQEPQVSLVQRGSHSSPQAPSQRTSTRTFVETAEADGSSSLPWGVSPSNRARAAPTAPAERVLRRRFVTIDKGSTSAASSGQPARAACGTGRRCPSHLCPVPTPLPRLRAATGAATPVYCTAVAPAAVG